MKEMFQEEQAGFSGSGVPSIRHIFFYCLVCLVFCFSFRLRHIGMVVSQQYLSYRWGPQDLFPSKKNQWHSSQMKSLSNSLTFVPFLGWSHQALVSLEGRVWFGCFFFFFFPFCFLFFFFFFSVGSQEEFEGFRQFPCSCR